MTTWLIEYDWTVLSFGLIGGLLLAQVLVSDVISIVAKHSPGAPVNADHSSLLFRVHRAHANTNETLAGFVVLTLFALAARANPEWLNGLAMTYIGARLAHMTFYYANLKSLRSVAFGISLVALVGILVAGLLAWF